MNDAFWGQGPRLISMLPPGPGLCMSGEFKSWGWKCWYNPECWHPTAPLPQSWGALSQLPLSCRPTCPMWEEGRRLHGECKRIKMPLSPSSSSWLCVLGGGNTARFDKYLCSVIHSFKHVLGSHDMPGYVLDTAVNCPGNSSVPRASNLVQGENSVS